MKNLKGVKRKFLDSSKIKKLGWSPKINLEEGIKKMYEELFQMRERPSITLLLPTFNEIDGLKLIFPKVDLSLFDDVLIVDGGSTDGTVEFAIENNIRIMSQLRSGLSEAVLDAIETINTDYVIEFSMDGNCLPEILEELVKEIYNGNDLVIVSRYLPPAKSYDDNLITALGNFLFSTIINLMGKPKITDSLGMYRGVLCAIALPEFKKFLVGPVFEPLTLW